ERNICLISFPCPPPTDAELDVLRARSLIASKRDVRGSAIFNRQILGNVSATINAEAEHNEGRSLLGEVLLKPLARNNTADSAHLGTTLNWDEAQWHWNVTGNADWERDLVVTDPESAVLRPDRTRETTTSGDLTATVNGNLFKVPAGNASTTLRAGV